MKYLDYTLLSTNWHGGKWLMSIQFQAIRWKKVVQYNILYWRRQYSLIANRDNEEWKILWGAKFI